MDYINLDWQVNHKEWNFITVTYHLATKRISVWKNYRRIHSRILPEGFKPSDTARDYLSVGYSSPLSRNPSVINYKGKMACLQMYNMTLAAGQIYRLMYECIGKEYMHKGLCFLILFTLLEYISYVEYVTMYMYCRSKSKN